jgi:hypothetical protein
VTLSVAEKYIEALAGIAKEGTTVVVPANMADVSSMVSQVLPPLEPYLSLIFLYR